MGFLWQKYWNGLPFPSPGDLPDPEVEPTSCASAMADGFFTNCATWEAVPFQVLPFQIEDIFPPTTPILQALNKCLWLINISS